MQAHKNEAQSNSSIITLSNKEKWKHQTIQELKDWLEQHQWDLFLTLTFQYPLKDSIKVSKAVEKFINDLSKKAFGRQSKKRVVCFPVIEMDHSESSYHVHILIQDPTPRILNEDRRKKFNLRSAIIESWLQASPYSGNPALSSINDEWLKEITDSLGLVDYMTKQLDSNSDTIVWDQVCVDGRQCA